MNQLVHLGIIMDGNRRWARGMGLQVFAGHRQGGENIRNIIKWSAEREIKVLTLYALSIENLQRPKREVDFLLKLAERFVDENIEELKEDGAKMQVFGRREGLPQTLVEKFAKLKEATRENDRIIVNILFNYSGRAEIIDTLRRMISDRIPADSVDEKKIEEYLWVKGRPDLVIRTGGEQRLSNFLIWQTAYSEFYACQKYWPDFTQDDLDLALRDFDRRKRNFGK